MKSSFEGGVFMSDTYNFEELPLYIDPEVREKCNN
jgi:hypothetical protein